MASKRCKQCKTKHTGDDVLKMKSTPSNLGLFCDFNCIADWVKDNPVKVKSNYKKAVTREKREFNDNDVGNQLKLTQTVFNKMRVLEEKLWFKLRGLEPECISCGKTNMDWCCGHFKTVGSQGALRFDKMNTYLQCNRYCNMGKSGNINGDKTTRGYIKGLHDRFGEDRAKSIIEYCETDRIAKWDAQELQELRRNLSVEVRKLESML